MVFQAFTASDGEVVIAAGNDRLFAKLAVAIGRADWAADPAFKTNAQRLERSGEILAEVARRIAAQPVAYWVDRLEAAGVPCAPIQEIDAVARHEQTQAIGIVREVPEVGLPTIGLPLSFDGERPPIRTAAPRLGEHNAEIRGEAAD
jgi:crotonobetainyl-CoA:carnitine CoA-transferase CaiB-like acyl-CoA transferase